MFAAPTQIPTASQASFDPNARLAQASTSTWHLPARCDLSDDTFSALTRHLSRPTPTSAELSLHQVLRQPDLCHDLTSATTWLLQRHDPCYDSTSAPTNGYPNTTSTTTSRLPQPTLASTDYCLRTTYTSIDLFLQPTCTRPMPRHNFSPRPNHACADLPPSWLLPILQFTPLCRYTLYTNPIVYKCCLLVLAVFL